VVDRLTYTYDRNGNRLTRTNALAAAFSERYSYDALNQLQSFARTGGTTKTQQWQFDALGNWTSVTTNSVEQKRTANAQNEVTKVGGKSLAYSRTGNLATDEQGRTLVYDGWNRLAAVQTSDGTEIARYEYDGLNRRIVEQVGSPTFEAPVRDVYYSEDWQVLEERVRGASSLYNTRFIWSPVYVDAMIARDSWSGGRLVSGSTDRLDQRVYPLQDANWNTTAIVSAGGVTGVAAGNVISRFAYTPYGQAETFTASWTALAAGATPATFWAHHFQGLESNAVTGLAYARNRDYSATLGRFIQLDPIGFQAGDNNLYRFLKNGPTGKVDPSGLCPESSDSLASPKVSGGNTNQRTIVARSFSSTTKHLDNAIQLFQTDWPDYLRKNPEGVLLTPILRSQTEREYWLGKLREARSLLTNNRNPIAVDISPQARGRHGANDSPAEVNCWQIAGYRWWSQRITVKPPFFDNRSSDKTRQDVIIHEVGRLVGIADGERGPRDDINTWDTIIRQANSYYDPR
jgi:RHS repeat-associated protein